MDTDSFMVHVKTDDLYKGIAEDIETRLDTSNFEQTDYFLKQKLKKVIGLMKDELGGQIMKQFFGLRARTYSYLKDNNDENIKVKGGNKCNIKRKTKLQDYKNCLEGTEIDNNINCL